MDIPPIEIKCADDVYYGYTVFYVDYGYFAIQERKLVGCCCCGRNHRAVFNTLNLIENYRCSHSFDNKEDKLIRTLRFEDCIVRNLTFNKEGDQLFCGCEDGLCFLITLEGMTTSMIYINI